MRWPTWLRRAPSADAGASTASTATESAGSTAGASASAIAKAMPGYAAPIGGPAPAAPTAFDKPAGADGVAIVGGFIVSNERDPRLTGTQKWVTYDNQVLNVAVIGAAVNVWTQLGGSAKWTAEPNKRGGPDADRGVQIVTEGLLEAQMSTPWRQVVRRQLMKKFRGFSLHEMLFRRRSHDDMVVVDDLQDRPQWTVYRWDRPDPKQPWRGVQQLIPIQTSDPLYIPRSRLFYSVENTLSPTPEGVGLQRQMAEATRVLELYQKWEGIGFQTDLRGVPLARAPIEEIQEQAKGKTPAEQAAFVAAQTQFLTNFLFGHNKTEEQGVLLSSATYRNRDPSQSVSSIQKWAFDLIKGATSSMPEMGTAIGRIVRDIARLMCAEWLLLGGEDSGGAYSMHEDKTAMFGLLVNSALGDIADDATRDIATALVALNGLDPETCTPRLVPEPVATSAVKDACSALASLAQAALDPRDKAINVLRSRMDLPPAPEPDEAALVAPRGDVELGPDGMPVERDPGTGAVLAPPDQMPGQGGS